MDIKGKVFIVTGGASGLGEGTARALAAQGGKVVIADMQTEKGEAVAQEIGGAFVKCDVSNEADGQAVVAKAVSLGKLMGLVNCAGIAPAEKTVGKHGAHNLGVFNKTITVNLVGSFNMIRLAAEAMSKNDPEATGERGVMISTASVAAYDGQIGQAAYSASKGGVVGMTGSFGAGRVSPSPVIRMFSCLVPKSMVPSKALTAWLVEPEMFRVWEIGPPKTRLPLALALTVAGAASRLSTRKMEETWPP